MALLVLTTALVLVGVGVGAGTSVAGRLITGADIKNGSVKSADIGHGTIAGSDIGTGMVGTPEIKNKSIEMEDLDKRTVQKLQTGAPGPAGPSGTAGPAGAPGQVLVSSKLTPANPAYGGAFVVDIESLAVSSGGPSASQGAQVVGPVHLTKGLYIVSTTAQFFDFKPTAGTPDVDYGVLRLFANGTGLAPSWSPVVPDDGNNAAQASGQLVLPVPAGGVTLTARAVLRGGDGGQAGAVMVITRVQPAG